MTIKQKLKEINNKLDLSKKYPGYFNKPLLRSFFIVFFIFIGILVLIYGNHTFIYIECPESSFMKCENPFIKCENSFIKSNYCTSLLNVGCSGLNCNKSHISPGEYIGEEIPWLVYNSVSISLLILFIGFGLNHLIYRRRKNDKIRN